MKVRNNKNQKEKKMFQHPMHTGKLMHRKHTSYGSLLAVVLLAFAPLAVISTVASADSGSSYSYQTFAVVPAAIPTTAPQITNLASGKVFASISPINVTGTCPSNTLVKIYKNDVMAGAALCTNGHFQIQMDLFQGQNTLTARAYNSNDIASPASLPINVALDLPGQSNNEVPGAANLPANQFYITSDVFYRGADSGQTMSWPITLSGGQPPYAVSVGWGDGKTDLFSQGSPGKLVISHSYTQAGTSGGYTIFINATDQNGDKSYLQLVAIVGGDKAVLPVSSGASGHNSLISYASATEVVGVIGLIVFSFWMGEKRELRLIMHKNGAIR